MVDGYGLLARGAAAIDAVDAAKEMEPIMAGVCFSMQPAQIEVALAALKAVVDAEQNGLPAETDSAA